MFECTARNGEPFGRTVQLHVSIAHIYMKRRSSKETHAALDSAAIAAVPRDPGTRLVVIVEHRHVVESKRENEM